MAISTRTYGHKYEDFCLTRYDPRRRNLFPHQVFICRRIGKPFIFSSCQCPCTVTRFSSSIHVYNPQSSLFSARIIRNSRLFNNFCTKKPHFLNLFFFFCTVYLKKLELIAHLSATNFHLCKGNKRVRLSSKKCTHSSVGFTIR